MIEAAAYGAFNKMFAYVAMPRVKNRFALFSNSGESF
jgi:hypothetical protein